MNFTINTYDDVNRLVEQLEQDKTITVLRLEIADDFISLTSMQLLARLLRPIQTLTISLPQTQLESPSGQAFVAIVKDTHTLHAIDEITHRSQIPVFGPSTSTRPFNSNASSSASSASVDSAGPTIIHPFGQLACTIFGGSGAATFTDDIEIKRRYFEQEKSTFLTTGAIPSDILALYGTGATLRTNKEPPMIDLCSGTLNCILGYNDPWVAHRIKAYLDSGVPQYVTIRMGADAYYHYAARLHHLFKAEGFKEPVINHRQCNGSDAIETAIHAASFYAQHRYGAGSKQKLASFKGSYHGQNLTACLVSEHQPTRPFLGDKQAVEMFDVPTYADATQQTLSATTEAFLDTLASRSDEFFAVLIEPIQVRNGIHECPLVFLQRLRAICTEKDICLIFDECQTGFGWLGSLSASQSHGVTPDIAAYSKAVTGGYGALGVMVAEAKYKHLSPTFSSKTNASAILTLIAADAVLDRLCGLPEEKIPSELPLSLKETLKTGLMEKVPEVSAQLAQVLIHIKQTFPTITGRIKGQGLVCGLEILDETGNPSEDLTKWLINQAFINGIYLRQADNCIIFKPPLVTTSAEFTLALHHLITTFQQGLDYLRECTREHRQVTTGTYHR